MGARFEDHATHLMVRACMLLGGEEEGREKNGIR